MPSFITASGEHHYTFISHKQSRPDYTESVWHYFKNADTVFAFVYWLQTVYDDRFKNFPVTLVYIVEHCHDEYTQYEAVFFKKEPTQRYEKDQITAQTQETLHQRL